MKTFSEKVWEMTRRIPRGRVSTYGAIARALKNPRAGRAVGQALNKNPYWPQVPCHRVVKSSGKVGGFAWGQRRKIALLKKEAVKIRGGKIDNFKGMLYKFR